MDEGLTVVDYWIELKPYLMLTWLVAMPVSFGVVVVGLLLAHLPLTDLWVFVPAAAVVIAPTVYISRRQAQWVVALLRRELEASNSPRVAS